MSISDEPVGSDAAPNQESQTRVQLLELAARWLDLIRPVWYEKLQDRKRRKPLLLKDIRKDLIAAEQSLLPRVISEFSKAFPAQRPADERIVACVIGIA